MARNLKSGKAVAIPKLGCFTFTFPNHLDMAGLTNPGYRDPQTRTPVFVVAKDFINGVEMRPGIAGSWSHSIHLNDKQSSTDVSSRAGSCFSFRSQNGSRNKVIPFDLKHMNGVIPQQNINYTEIAVLTGDERVTKGTCRDHIELIARKYSDKARAGLKVEAIIPHVGKLSISIGICAVIFNEELIEATRGKTAILHKNRHHSASIPNNLMNTKMLEKNLNQVMQSNNFNSFKNQLDKEFENQTGEKSI